MGFGCGLGFDEGIRDRKGFRFEKELGLEGFRVRRGRGNLEKKTKYINERKEGEV